MKSANATGRFQLELFVNVCSKDFNADQGSATIVDRRATMSAAAERGTQDPRACSGGENFNEPPNLYHLPVHHSRWVFVFAY